MSTSKTLLIPPLTALALSAAVWLSPPASAMPQCVYVSPQTTQCQTRGSAQITTSPPPVSYGWPGWGWNNGWGWGWGGPGFVIGFG
ncbi:MAG: hypothetical protein WBB07_29555 [Mycobacterium sp.]